MSGRNVTPEAERERFKLYRLNDAGEKEEVATAADASGVGQAIVQLGREGMFEGSPLGVLDTEGDIGKKWLVRPWLPSPKNVSDAGRVLATARKGEK